MKSCFHPRTLFLLQLVISFLVPLEAFSFHIRALNNMALPSSSSSALLYTSDKEPCLEKPETIVREQSLIFRPGHPPDNRDEENTPQLLPLERPLQVQTAFVLVPGCSVDPRQYEDLAHAIQEKATHPVWVMVLKPFLNMPNPLTTPAALQDAVRALHSLGYPSDQKVFLAGHSCGGAFLPQIWNRLEPTYRASIAGVIHLGSFMVRQNREAKNAVYLSLPRLTVVGDLDGLIRPSRIAEDIKHHVQYSIDSGEDATETRLGHSVVLVPGMNHFQITGTDFEHILKGRDLAPEISREEAIQETAAVITQFMEIHQTRDGNDERRKESLLRKIVDTETYLQPLLDAMKLEGNHHLATPCNLCEDSCDLDAECYPGSAWVEKIQQEITPEDIQVDDVSDEFHRVWYINPFVDPPFYHPWVQRKGDAVTKVVMETVSEAVYEKPDFFFDGGFFSNTAVELKAKMNSPQAIWDALGTPVPFEPGSDTCSKMNAFAIQHALDEAPDVVRRRYLERGVKLQVGRDVEHTSGPAWIWSHLDFSKEGDCGNEECRIIDSHAMYTPLDHPVPFAGGKLYCKLLSPARALEWMYTDSLRE